MAFKPSGEQNKQTKEDCERKDEYLGKYKERHHSASEEEKFAIAQSPAISDELMAKGLKKVGGS